ncbi:PAS domain-containing protein [Rhizobium sp. Leaf341]|uniref:PAS domain-containing protein n=1 Tax=Rhizobium sp. Leaf341 TaxID=1736344 RepID=UPI000713A3F3|nr:PAS domain-containing protein [Rhizobium sp. Leaf341]KQR67981.1 hypothetical protein ASG03_10805 [Rhizobium sp. Leaf341]
MKTRTSTEIFRYWQSLCENGRIPSREHLDPGAIRDVLPDVFILEPTDADSGRTMSPRFRLAGTRLCALFVRELRGTGFDTLWSAADMQALNDVTRRVQRAGEPAVIQASGMTGGGERLATELVLLPLTSRSGRLDRIFGSLAPTSRPTWIGAHPLPFLSINHVDFLQRDTPVGDVAVRTTVSRTVTSAQRPTAFHQALSRVMHLSVFDGGKGH